MIARMLARMRRVAGTIKRRLDPYPSRLRAEIAARQPQLTRQPPPGELSVLTTVYEKTPVAFFRELAASLFQQTARHFEWIVLAHGPLPAGLDLELQRLQADPRISVHRLEQNLGILGGMRYCLNAARGKYAVPVDADDLLTPDALQLVWQALHASKALFVYTNEDMLIDGRLAAPFRRPDWDPVLNLSTSYIWHLCAFCRQEALGLGVYGDERANYCHDWDTVSRFAAAGHVPLHVPHVAYHWRRHAQSTTNRPQAPAAALESQRFVLQQWVQRQPSPDVFEVRPFPLDRGAPEWWIARRPVDPPVVDVLLIPGSPSGGDTPVAGVPLAQPVSLSSSKTLAESVAQAREWRHAVDYPLRSVSLMAGTDTDSASRQHLPDVACLTRREATDRFGMEPAAVVVVCPVEARMTSAAIWEAVSLFQQHSDLVLIGGRISNARGRVVRASWQATSRGPLACPEQGQRVAAPGPYSMWLKTRTVDAVDPALFAVRGSWLAQHLSQCLRDDWDRLADELNRAAADQGRRIAASPLLWAVDPHGATERCS